jgi:protein-arginine kinase activator protein McsA
MLCNVCHQHAQFERTVFHEATPTKVRLCEPCADKVELVEHMHRITEATDHATKTAEVDSLLAAVKNARSGLSA